MAVEGRLAALLYGDEDHRLLGRVELAEGVEAAAAVAGVELGDELLARGLVPELGRADLTSELHFADGAEGVELLRAASYVDLPWLKVGTEGGKRGGLETVHWRGVRGRSTVLRLYDKGVETGQAGPGEWLRLERQRRWRKRAAPAVVEVAAGPLRDQFVGRELVRLVEGADDVHVCDRWSAIELVRERLAAGAITRARADGVASYLALGELELPRRTSYRRAAQLRELGIAVNPNEGAVSSFPVGRLLATFAEAWAA